jgi:DNA polymerase I-like protein with 3'-5' exonuclease and polymerase domains
MQPEQRRLYEDDLLLAEAGRAMQERGLLVDQVKRHQLDSLLRYRMGSYLGKLRAQSGLQNLQPTKLADLRKAIFRVLHAPVLFRSLGSGQASTGRETLHTLASMKSAGGNFCKLLLAWRKAQKLRAVYVSGIDVEDDGAVHPSWRSWGTVSGRFSARHPNLQNLPRPTPGDDSPQRIKEMYIPRKGMVFIGYDSKQIEMRIAAYLSLDPALIQAVESEYVHAVNAKVLFGELPDKLVDPILYKKLRTAGKQSGFAMNYRAGAEAVQKKLVEDGFNVEITQVQAMLNRLKKNYHVYFEWQDRMLEETCLSGWMATLSGRRRWFGHTPLPTEVANQPIQGGAADVINRVLIKLARVLPPMGAYPLAQVHDHVLVECPKSKAVKVSNIIQQVAEEPWTIHGVERMFPIEIQTSDENWSCV